MHAMQFLSFVVPGPYKRSVTSSHGLAAGLLRGSSRGYAAAAIAELQRRRADLLATALPPSFGDPLDDTEVRILHLAESVGVDRPALLQKALAWYKVAFHHRGVPPDWLPANLDAIAAALQDELPPQAAAVVTPHLQAARAAFDRAPVDLPSHVSRDAPHGDAAAHFLLAILEGRGDDALDLLRRALDRGVSIADLHDHVIVPAQREAGRMWLMGEIPIADEHYGSSVVDRALWLLQERLPRPPANAPRVMTMGVGGNLHEFGLRLVAQRLQLAGFAVHHLGSNMPSTDLEWLLQDRAFDVIAISATLTLHLGALVTAVARIRGCAPATGAKRPRVLVGGEPFALVPDLFAVVGADAGAGDAEGAVAAVRRLLARA